MALKIQHKKIHPESPENNNPLGGDHDDEEEARKEAKKCFRKKRKERDEEDPEDEEEKPKSFKAKVKNKSGGIYLIIHESVCLVLFFFIETQIHSGTLSTAQLFIPIAAAILFLLSLIFLLAVTMMDPGVQPKKSPEHQQLEINYYNTHRVSPSPVLRPMLYYGKAILGNYCYECKHFKHPRTVHCNFCDRCIIRFDHHCNVLGTCVGIRNFPFYFYLMSTVFIYYLYMTIISILVLVRKLMEDKPTVVQLLQNVSILWIVIITVIIMIVSDMCHLLFFPCVYLYITAMDKTARELFFVIETGGEHHYKCYKVLKTIQDKRRKGSWLCSCCNVINNLSRYLCTSVPPSLLKEDNYYVVCDLDEALVRDSKKPSSPPLIDSKLLRRSKSEFDLRSLYQENENMYNVQERTKSCCKF